MQKSFFAIYLDLSSARKLWNFKWGTRILKKYGKIDHSTINLHNHKRNFTKKSIYRIVSKNCKKNTVNFLKNLEKMWWGGGGGEPIKAVRNRVYLKAAADDKTLNKFLLRYTPHPECFPSGRGGGGGTLGISAEVLITPRALCLRGEWGGGALPFLAGVFLDSLTLTTPPPPPPPKSTFRKRFYKYLLVNFCLKIKMSCA